MEQSNVDVDVDVNTNFNATHRTTDEFIYGETTVFVHMLHAPSHDRSCVVPLWCKTPLLSINRKFRHIGLPFDKSLSVVFLFCDGWGHY